MLLLASLDACIASVGEPRPHMFVHALASDESALQGRTLGQLLLQAVPRSSLAGIVHQALLRPPEHQQPQAGAAALQLGTHALLMSLKAPSSGAAWSASAACPQCTMLQGRTCGTTGAHSGWPELQLNTGLCQVFTRSEAAEQHKDDVDAWRAGTEAPVLDLWWDLLHTAIKPAEADVQHLTWLLHPDRSAKLYSMLLQTL